MRDFAGTSQLASLPRPARLLYSVFALLSGLGVMSCGFLYDEIVQFQARATPADLHQRLAAHYQSVTHRALLETMHAHLFSMPVLLLVAGHLFLLTSASSRIKVGLIATASGATVLHILAPWLMRWAGDNPLVAVVFPLSGALLLITYMILLCVPVYAMWRH